MNQHRQLGLASAVGATSLAFFLAATSVQAAIIAYEDFESYTDGGTIINGTGGSGWMQPWIGATNGTPVTNASSGKIAGYGKSLELGAIADNRGIGVRQFPAQTGDVYFGMVLQTTNEWETDFWQTYVNNTYSTADGTQTSFSAGLANVATTDPYFARKGGTTTNTSTLSHTSVNNDIHTIVMKFSKSTGQAADLYDQVSMWVDQVTQGTPTATLGAADVGTAALNSATLSTLHFRVSSLEATDRVYLDNLTVATTFAEALPVPEPSSVALLIGGLAVVAIRTTNRRRCQQHG